MDWRLASARRRRVLSSNERPTGDPGKQYRYPNYTPLLSHQCGRVERPPRELLLLVYCLAMLLQLLVTVSTSSLCSSSSHFFVSFFSCSSFSSPRRLGSALLKRIASGLQCPARLCGRAGDLMKYLLYRGFRLGVPSGKGADWFCYCTRLRNRLSRAAYEPLPVATCLSVRPLCPSVRHASANRFTRD